MDIKWQILEVLLESKQPMRPHRIAQAIGKTQSHVEYHLKQLVEQGRVICYNEGIKRYAAQLILTTDRVSEDFYQVIAKAIPKLMCYMDLSQANDQTAAFIENIKDWLHKMEREIARTLKTPLDSKKV